MDEQPAPHADTAADSEQPVPDDELAPGDEPASDDVDDIDAREAARIHRRDHDAEAHRRELLRPGMGKVFKQITDSWERKSDADHDKGHHNAGRHDH